MGIQIDSLAKNRENPVTKGRNMNEVLVDNTYGRDHVRELIEEAQQQRFARQSEKVTGRSNRLQRAQSFITKALVTIIK